MTMSRDLADVLHKMVDLFPFREESHVVAAHAAIEGDVESDKTAPSTTETEHTETTDA